MPFLGNTPANTFVSIAKQTITGNGGTAYTLSYPVTNANEIDVFFNNVRQEPGVAYTASATTITFSEAIASTDSVYIVFNGQAVGTIDAPAGAYLPTTGGTINGSVGIKVNANSGTPLLIGRVNTVAEGGEIGLTRASDNATAYAIDVYGNTSTPSLRIIDNTAAVVRLEIDGSGCVTKPSQPAFIAYVQNDTTLTPNVTHNISQYYNLTDINVGNNYNTSNGRFTAPVTGVYAFNFKYYTYPIASTESFLFVNGDTWIRYQMIYNYSGNTNPGGGMGSAIIKLNAGDYVSLHMNFNTVGGSNASLWNGGPRSSHWSGYLLG